MRSILITIIVLFVGSVGCQDDGPQPISSNESVHPKLAVENTPAKTQPRPKEVELAPEPKIHVPPPEAIQAPDPEGVEEKPVVGTASKEEQKEKALPPLEPLPVLTDKQSQRVCMRSCNKTHQCDFVRGSVALCVTRCVDTQKNTTDRVMHQEARLFRAQSECADKACASFQPCVVKELLGAKALSNAPPMPRDKTESFCKALCGKQKICEPTYFASIPGGMVTCVANCQQLAIRPDKTAASQRVIMNAAFACVDKECGQAFGDCAREKMTMPPSSSSGGHAP